MIGLGTSRVFDVEAEERGEPPSRALAALVRNRRTWWIRSRCTAEPRLSSANWHAAAGLRDRLFLASKVWTTGA